MPAIYGASGYPISILDLDDWDMAERILTNADVVIISVPIDHTLETIERLKPYLTENMLLADLTSVKRAPLAKMLDVHKGANSWIASNVWPRYREHGKTSGCAL